MSTKYFLSIFLGISFLIVGYWFNNVPVLNAAVWAIPEVCSDNLLQKQNEITCQWNGGGGPPFPCSVHAECCVLCETSTAACIIIEPDRSPFDAWSYTDNEGDNSGGYQESCNDVGSFWTYCERSVTGSCPSGFSNTSFEGYNCGIFKEKDVDNVYAAKGKWNASQEECIVCDNKIEDKVCATTGSSFLNNSGDCNGAGDGTFQLACDASISVNCDDKLVGDICDTGKECNANGQCVATGLSLSISADPTAINSTSTSAIDFLVEDASGNSVSGATVTITAVTEAAGTVMVGTSCTTNLSGICPGGLTYGSGLSIGLKTITAKADDGVSPVVSSSVDVIVSDANFECDITGTKWFDPVDFDMGDCSDLNGETCGSGEYENCGLCKESNCPDGTFSSCFSKYQVCGCDCVAVDDECTSVFSCTTSACIETSPTSAEATETCVDAADCVADTVSTVACCLKDEHCAADLVCDTDAEKCVECITDADCAGTDICIGGFCQGCSEEGEDPGDAALCCVGLSYLDIDGDGSFFCTSVCDPNAWFFCNPLRGTIGTFVEAGETLLGFILGLIGSIALLFIIIAGVMYMTSAGNEERISSSKRILSGAVIGLMIALLAYGLLHVIMTVLGM